MKCTECSAETEMKPWDAMKHGWRRVTVETAGRIKYGIFCPKETNSKIALKTEGWLAQAPKPTAAISDDDITRLQRSRTQASSPREIPVRGRK